MSCIAKSKAGRKQATTGGRVTKTPSTKKDTVRQWIITFLHGHEFIDVCTLQTVYHCHFQVCSKADLYQFRVSKFSVSSGSDGATKPGSPCGR